MHARTKCALVFINSLILCRSETYGYFGSIRDTTFVQERKRATRQSGYVYERPNISFNLPSRDIPVATSTQASPVDRTVMQMYYAYPAPASGNALNVGTSTASTGYSSGLQSGSGSSSRGNIGTSTFTESGGYNYNAPSDGRGSISQTNQQVTSVITSGATLSSGGYNYGSQAVSTENRGGGSTETNNQVVSVTNTLPSSGGYNYRAPVVAGNDRSPQVNQQASVTNVISNTGSGTSGYNYGVEQNIVKAGSDGGSSLAITGNSFTANTESGSRLDSTGYSYDKKTALVSGVLQSGLQGDTMKSTDGSRFVGYNYEVQKGDEGVSKTSSISDTSGYSVKSPVQTTTIATVSVSTNAPEYLPPKSNTDNTNVLNTNNNNLNSGAAVTVQPDVYLPPSISDTQKLTETQSGSNVQPETNNAPSSSYLPPLTSNDAIIKTISSTIPIAVSDVYLPPVSPNPTSIQTTSTFTQSLQNSNTDTSTSNQSLNPKTFLQPSSSPLLSNEKVQTSLTVSNQPISVPSTNYLPPIPTSREINELVSTPAATYLPPVL